MVMFQLFVAVLDPFEYCIYFKNVDFGQIWLILADFALFFNRHASEKML